MTQAASEEPEKRSGDKRKQEALKQEDLARKKRNDEMDEQRRWKQKCAGCRKRGHTAENCPCKLQGERKEESKSVDGSRKKAQQGIPAHASRLRGREWQRPRGES